MHFRLPPQRLYGNREEPECVIHGSLTYPPREPTPEDIKSLRERDTFKPFEYREEDWDYDLDEELADAFEDL